ncbi:MAG: citrate synthase [Clostridiales bacterium]|jgi:citrate synthase|nr:citrate synthase [Clostridiales bacterium]
MVLSGSNSQLNERLKPYCEDCRSHIFIEPSEFADPSIKRGLRNADGTGVVAGVTKISDVHGYVLKDGVKLPDEGRLYYRGIDVRDIIYNCTRESRFGFEEVVWLLLFGYLPTSYQLDRFAKLLEELRELPDGFVEDMIIKAPSPDIMNKLGRSVLALYSYDDNADEISLENVFRQSFELVARISTIAVNAYQVKKRYYDHKSLFFHPPIPGLSVAENILSTMRIDRKFTHREAMLLDTSLILHAEHGGGNNSTFACRVVSSSATDTYSAIAAAIGSLKGPRHGGANTKVIEMLDHIKAGVKDYNDDEEISNFLRLILQKKAGDGSGLIYGIGHAVYTKSDPRADILKKQAGDLAKETGYTDDMKLLEAVERLAPCILTDNGKKQSGSVCANFDLYSGIVYRMLGIPPELYTPLFAVARMAGWCAHRIEELMTCNRIIRPAYKTLGGVVEYTPISDRVSTFTYSQHSEGNNK